MRTAKFELGDTIATLPMSYLVQQTCASSVFEGVPESDVDMDALVDANRVNKELTWYQIRNNTLHICVPTGLITWEEEKDDE